MRINNLNADFFMGAGKFQIIDHFSLFEGDNPVGLIHYTVLSYSEKPSGLKGYLLISNQD